MEKPVAIVGAGVAGLACAIELERAGVPYVLLEGGDRVGGRVRTDVVEGFRLDWGYQVYFEAYPNLARLLDPAELELGPFKKGAAFVDAKGVHTVEEPSNSFAALRMAFDRSVSLRDKLLVRKWTGQVRGTTIEGLRSMGDSATSDHLRGFGFSDEFTRGFLRPFLAGVSLDKNLGFSRQQFAFVWKMLSEGKTGLPKEGMGAVPRLMAKELNPGSLRTYSRVAAIEHTPAGAVAGVRLETRERLEARAVVLACDPETAGELLGEPVAASYLGSTTVWFQAGGPPVPQAHLVLNGTGSGIINHISPSSMAQPSYAPRGSQLVGVSILGVRPEGDEELAETLRKEIAKLLPDAGSSLYRLLRVDRIERAHLVEAPGYRSNAPKTETQRPNVFLAGEVTANASLDGAAESGIRAARKAMATSPTVLLAA